MRWTKRIRLRCSGCNSAANAIEPTCGVGSPCPLRKALSIQKDLLEGPRSVSLPSTAWVTVTRVIRPSHMTFMRSGLEYSSPSRDLASNGRTQDSCPQNTGNAAQAPRVAAAKYEDEARYRRPQTGDRESGPRQAERHQRNVSINGAEPVRRVFWNDHEIALRDLPRGAAFDGGAGEIVSVGLLVGKLAAGDQGRGAVNHIEKLRVLFVNGGGSHGGAIFQIGAIGRERQQRLCESGLVGFTFFLG